MGSPPLSFHHPAAYTARDRIFAALRVAIWKVSSSVCAGVEYLADLVDPFSPVTENVTMPNRSPTGWYKSLKYEDVV